jgi:meiotically up-regulated gene 157 (Mug157) protein
MSKEELLRTEAKYVMVSPLGLETNLYTEDQMVAAYNKALEDVGRFYKQEKKKGVQAVYVFERLKELKIRV